MKNTLDPYLYAEKPAPFRRRPAGRRLPLGYRWSEKHPRAIEPIPEAIAAIREAFGLLDRGCSFRDIAVWLGNKLGRPVDYTFLFQLYKRHRQQDEAYARIRSETGMPENPTD